MCRSYKGNGGGSVDVRRLVEGSRAAMERFEATGNIVYLDTVIDALRAAVRTVPRHTQLAPVLRDRLVNVLMLRHDTAYDRGMAEELIAWLREQVDDTVGETRLESLCRLCLALIERFERYGEPSDLEELHALSRRVIETSEGIDFAESTGWLYLGAALWHRFRLHDRAEDLEECLRAHDRAVALLPPEIPQVGQFYAARADAYELHHARTGVPASLDRAIADFDEAFDIDGGLDLNPAYVDPDQAWRLFRLGCCHYKRYQALGAAADLLQAHLNISWAADAQPGRSVFRSMLSEILLARMRLCFARGDGDQAHRFLDDAVGEAQRAMRSTDRNDPDHPMTVISLGAVLTERFVQRRIADDLATALRLLRSAEDGVQRTDPRRRALDLTLGEALVAEAGAGGPARSTRRSLFCGRPPRPRLITAPSRGMP